jgi:hypothetical protein
MGKWIARIMCIHTLYYVVDYRSIPSIMSMN